MCSLCQSFNPHKDSCDYANLPSGLFAVERGKFAETGDAPSGMSTPYRIEVGDSFAGSIAASSTDWVGLNVEAGKTYNISLNADGAGDALLSLYDEDGDYIGYDDDSGDGTGALANYTATYTGTVYLAAAEFSDASLEYSLAVSRGTAHTQFTLDQIATQLTDTYWGGSERKLSVSAGDTLTVNITELTDEGQQLARWALEAWTAVSGLQFKEVAGFATLSFDDEARGAHASSATAGSRIYSSNINVSKDWLTSFGTSIDSYSFQTYMHEIGHAIGLGHSGNYNGSGDYGLDSDFRNDSWQDTVMSYFSQSENYNVDATYAYAVSLMAADIVAIQNLYGTDVTNEAGDTVYGANATVSGYLGTYFKQEFDQPDVGAAVYSGRPTAVTIFDTGGIDTFDFSSSALDQLINLNDEAQSNVDGHKGNIIIARGTVIEHSIGGAGNDKLIGNEAGNTLKGGVGHDTLLGASGDDELLGGAGVNELIGGDGNDTATFESFDANLGIDLFAGFFDGGAGLDTLDLSGNFSDYAIVQNGDAFKFFHTGYSDVAGLGRLIATATNVEMFEGVSLTNGSYNASFSARATVAVGTTPQDLALIRDFDGNDVGAKADWKTIGQADIEFDGDAEFVFVNPTLGRWAVVGPSTSGVVDFGDYGALGQTRVVGTYVDPLVAAGGVTKGSAADSQQRFKHDLTIDNLTVIDAFDFNGDGFQEIYFQVTDGTAYLRALMHKDGNIQYANYQSGAQVEEYLTGLGYDQTVLETILI